MAEVRYQRGDNDERPWGRWEVLDTGEGFAVKRITVKPVPSSRSSSTTTAPSTGSWSAAGRG